MTRGGGDVWYDSSLPLLILLSQSPSGGEKGRYGEGKRRSEGDLDRISSRPKAKGLDGREGTEVVRSGEPGGEPGAVSLLASPFVAAGDEEEEAAEGQPRPR